MTYASIDEVHSLERFLSRSEVAELLGVSSTTVTRWAREGRLPCQKTLGGHHRFERTVIEEVRERMRQGALPAFLEPVSTGHRQ